MNNEELMEKLNWRYATKGFDPARSVSETNWPTLEQVLRLAPVAKIRYPKEHLIK